jgi:hypothetical protein
MNYLVWGVMVDLSNFGLQHLRQASTRFILGNRLTSAGALEDSLDIIQFLGHGCRRVVLLSRYWE